MFIRFVINNNDPDSGKRQGLFQAISELKSAGRLLPYEQLLYDEIYDWLRHNLKKPRNLSKSSKPHAKNVAISWFKDSAKKHIDKMRSLVNILNSHGVVTEMIRSGRPGYIVYEDEFQIAAEPFKETGT
jgi:hypothetical protein